VGETLAVLDAKLGSIIKEKLDIPCVYSSAVQELARGVRAQMSGLIRCGRQAGLRGMEAVAASRAFRGLFFMAGTSAGQVQEPCSERSCRGVRARASPACRLRRLPPSLPQRPRRRRPDAHVARPEPQPVALQAQVQPRQGRHNDCAGGRRSKGSSKWETAERQVPGPIPARPFSLGKAQPWGKASHARACQSDQHPAWPRTSARLALPGLPAAWRQRQRSPRPPLTIVPRPPSPAGQAIGLLDDLDKELNTYAMRVREWYGWHFPEMTKIVGDNISYAKAVRRRSPGSVGLRVLGTPAPSWPPATRSACVRGGACLGPVLAGAGQNHLCGCCARRDQQPAALTHAPLPPGPLPRPAPPPPPP
jgi:hypothetical protein